MDGPASGRGWPQPTALVIGADVGSTTVKAVAVDPATREILWSDYQRHETRQAAKLLELLSTAVALFPAPAERIRIFLTGSGASPLAESLGAAFVQEVNAVTLAVEALHPDVRSVVELGGQDAKIILFQQQPGSGERQAICSMNDKCASGTGATIDKCLIKVGMSADEVAELRFDPSRLHKVAAKCGVFAETDVVNLIKAGIPAAEVVCSLADAIVSQNLSVLARGNTLRDAVLLLGGPNTYLPLLQDCWRLRLPETWQQRRHEPAADVPLDELIRVPPNAQFYAAYGAVLYGLDEPEQVGRFRGLDGLRARVEGQAAGGLARAGAGPPLVARASDLDDFRRQYRIPPFEPARFEAGTTIHGAIGLDGGSTSSKAVLLSEDGDVLAKSYRLSRGNPLRDMQELLADLQSQVDSQGAALEALGFGATGYAADVLEEALAADVNIVETVAHARSAVHFCGELDVLCDIGGQDIKVLLLENGEIRDFRLSNQCSAGNGMLLQAMADQFGVRMTDYANAAFAARQTPVFSYGCAVFLDSDRVNFQKEGYSRDELLAGLALVLPKNVWQYVVQIPRLATLGRRFVLQGGTQYNLAAVKAQVDYIRARVPDAEVRLHPHPGEAGAIGAALEALRVVRRRGHSTFVGLEAALSLAYTTRNDETTRCRFCPNLCSRTFVETSAPDGRTSRYISGFSCEKGTVESKDEVRRLVQRRNELKAQHVNLVEYEARLAFRSFYQPDPLPEAGTPIDDLEVRASWWRGIRRRRVRRGFRRSDAAAEERRRRLRIGLPRVLNMYSMGPLFRTYFETLGVPASNVVFSPPTSEELYQAGAKYGAVDPCFPAKVAQAHLHHLLLHVHQERPLDFIFFPSLTHVPTFVENTLDATTCPIVAGTPNVLKAAFTRELDFFAEHGVDYVDGAVTPVEPTYFRRQMFDLWGERLGITEDESDFAVSQGFEALRRFDADLQRRGQEVLEQVEDENRVALLMIGRPYHNDPGLNHGVLEQFQALGYPVLSIRSIPKDPAWLGRWFADDDSGGRAAGSLETGPLDINDVWPENYSTNSVQKVWAAKFAARHPHVAVLDLSSFKCGHDAPTYGLISEIIKAGGKPYMALHDLDANKPAGSLKIRVKTYAAALARYEEDLGDRASRQSEFERRVSQKRRTLLAARRHALAAAAERDATIGREFAEMSRAFENYVQEAEAVLGMTAADLDREFAAARPEHDRTADVAPLAPVIEPVARNRGGPSWGSLPIVTAAREGCESGCGSGGCSSTGCGASAFPRPGRGMVINDG